MLSDPNSALIMEYELQKEQFDVWIRGFEARYTADERALMRWVFTVGFKKGQEYELAKCAS